MTGTSLKTARNQRGWNQQTLAKLLGVSQTLVSLWEQGARGVPARWRQQLRQLGLELDPTELPMRDEPNPATVDFAQELANDGYPGFAHLKESAPGWNPAQLLVMALSESNLDRRVAEALPWLVLRYSQMNWEWVFREAKLRDLQNRLGFTLALGKRLALQKQQNDVAAVLMSRESALRGSLLAKEETYGNDRMTQAERSWLRARRPAEAAAWHILSDMEPAHLIHA